MLLPWSHSLLSLFLLSLSHASSLPHAVTLVILPFSSSSCYLDLKPLLYLIFLSLSHSSSHPHSVTLISFLFSSPFCYLYLNSLLFLTLISFLSSTSYRPHSSPLHVTHLDVTPVLFLTLISFSPLHVVTLISFLTSSCCYLAIIPPLLLSQPSEVWKHSSWATGVQRCCMR